ncbi:ABC transporter ATP-binding protein [Mesobacterium pallidum]|uniref:ABC transporter ATP-binding protein n=1 Tax=Mesobacterium pallidum TaxID=2872037 RepID=UPI001EE26ACD|nr:ABC transporter ATP-binding protein [Mesobacterium pallidum]
MIRFENVSKSFRVRGVQHLVIDQLNATLPTGDSLALLGRNGAGKSTLMQMISGSVRPDTGRIVSDGTISWTVGFSGSFHRELTAAQNVRFLARVYGVDTEELIDFVRDFADIGDHFFMPVKSYSSGMRARVSFGASMGIPFDTYLVDEATAVGDATFKAKSKAVFDDRMQRSSAILVSHDLGQIREMCNAAAVLEHGHLTYYHDVDEAIEVHKAMMNGTYEPPAPDTE